MNIQHKIDGLTEAKAKYALSHLVNYIGATSICKRCVFRYDCHVADAKTPLDEDPCKGRILSWALDEEG